MRIGIAISNAASTTPTHTTVHLAAAALERGHSLRFLEPWDFELGPTGRIGGRAHAFDRPVDAATLATALADRRAERRRVEVDRLDLLLLRINPLDHAVLAFAQLAADRGIPVLNAPHQLAATSHKAWLASLPGVATPPTLVTRSPSAVEAFASTLDAGVVLKPARSSGGKGVVWLRKRRRALLDAAFDEAARAGDGYVVVQEYLPAAVQGERRLLWQDGELVGGYLRRRPEDDFRHNLKVGATPEPWPIGEADRALVAPLAGPLRARGVWLAGIDAIGRHVVEVNVINPGGVYWSSTFSGEPLAARLVRSLEEIVARRAG